VPSVVSVKRAICLVAAVLGVLTVAVAVPGAPARAATPQDRQAQIDRELARLHDQIGEATEQQARLIAELQVSRRARTALDGKVADLDRQIAASQLDLDAVTAELDAAVVAQQAAEEALDDAKAELRQSTAELREQALQAYMHFGDSPSAESTLNDLDDVNEAPRIATYYEVMAENQQQVIDEHRARQQDLDVLQDAATAAKDAVAERQAQIAARRAELQTARDAQAAARNQVAAEAAIEQGLLARVQAQKSAYLAHVNQLERESGQIAFDLARRQSGQTAPPARKGVLSWPVANPVVTSEFGYRIHPIYGTRRLHAGIDIAANTGTPVMAAAAGTVITAGWMSGYGYTVVIDHGGALATLYAHNSALSVSPGQQVARGQRIASAGSTGNSTGPHVHFEVRVKGEPVNPRNYL
jgi:murein DD-endopeptidase MepM/ murein hydrolase activator NlpD